MTIRKRVFFGNSGLLDLRAATLMGVNVKVGTSPIGHFGTGFKFGVATLLRTGHAVDVYIGTEKHSFGIAEESIRGQPFEVVTLDGVPLGFTTQTGKNWEMWMAYRELRCNAMDEDDWCITDDDEDPRCVPQEGRTVIVVDGEELHRAHRNRDMYFCNDRRVLFEKEGLGQILSGPSDVIFYRGVAVHKLADSSLYTYNIASTELTEDRTIKDVWYLPYRVGMLVAAATDADIVGRVVCAPEKTFEHKLVYGNGNPSEEFMHVTRSNRMNQAASSSALQLYREHAPKNENVTFIQLDLPYEAILQQAFALCRRVDVDFDLERSYIKIVETLGAGVLGLCVTGGDDDAGVYLPRNLIEVLGLNQTAGTLYEEWLHQKRSIKDNSREMQNHLLDTLFKYVQRHPG